MSEADDREETGPEGADVIEISQARRTEQLSLSDSAGEPLDGDSPEEEGSRVPRDQLEGVIESLLFASDRSLGLADLALLTGEAEPQVLAGAVQGLRARREGSGIEVAEVAGGFTLRTRVAHAPWVAKLLTGRPVRMSRALLETVAIIAYRQPITRPELDEIRGVDCGPVLKTLLDRSLIRIIGKKEEVGRPILYGTTPEFLRIFSLKDLTQLPTLRQFHELSAEHQATLDAKHGAAPGSEPPSGQLPLPDPFAGAANAPVLERRVEPSAAGAEAAAGDPAEDADLLEELESASEAAAQAARALHPEGESPDGAPEPGQARPKAPSPG